MNLHPSTSNSSTLSIDLELDNHIKKITELQSLIQNEESAVFECLSKKKALSIQ